MTLEGLISRAKARGSERLYLDWLRLQPSAVDGGFDWDMDTGRGYCQACHYRTSVNSGTGCKPEYQAVPLTAAQHRTQHQIGQFAFMPRDWWEGQVLKYLARWLES